MIRILAVCAGNICRSPAAEAAIRMEAERHGINIEVDSAGTGSWNIGEGPNSQMVRAGKRIGVDIGGRARRFIAADFDRFDIIVVMDRSNLRDVLALAPSLEARAKVRLLRTYDPESESDEIADPYGRPDEVFDQTMHRISASASGLVETLVSAGVQGPMALE